MAAISESDQDEKHILLYFGLQSFLWKEIDKPTSPVSSLPISNHPDFLSLVRYDIQLFNREFKQKQGLKAGKEKEHEQLPWSDKGAFQHVRDTCVWLYQHTYSTNCSAVKFDSFRNSITITYALPPDSCTDDSDHCSLDFFFKDNGAMKHACSRGHLLEEAQPQLYEQFMDVVNDKEPPSFGKPYFTPSEWNRHGIYFKENVWTQRLFGALCYWPIIDRPMENQMDQTSLPPEYVLCYPFKGATDLVIRRRALKVIADPNEFDLYDESSSLESLHSSEEDSIEIAKQAEGTASLYPQKLGELLSGMHMLSVQKVLRMLLRKRNISKFKTTAGIQRKGVYISKPLGAIQCSLAIPLYNVNRCGERTTCVTVDKYLCSSLDARQLCGHLKRLLSDD